MAEVGEFVAVDNEFLIKEMCKFLGFSMDVELEKDLNKGIMPERLKNMFETKGAPLSENITVKKENENKWVITDEEKKDTYIVRKEDGKLNICKEANDHRKKYSDFIIEIYEKWIKNNVPSDIESRIRTLVEQSRYLDWVLYLTNKRYRDHYQHQFNVGALGWFLLQIHVSNDMTLEQKIADRYSWELKDVHTAWWISSLLHDHGYPISYLFSSIPAMRRIRLEFETLKSSIEQIEDAITDVYHYTLCRDFAKLIYEQLTTEEVLQEKVGHGIDLLGFPEIKSKDETGIHDHGVLSAANLALVLKDGLNDVLKEAAKAMALHNNTKIEVEIEENPLAFLLILCDELQEWGRKMIISDDFTSELEQIKLGPFLKKGNGMEFSELLKVKFEYEDARILRDTNWSYELFNKSKLENFKRLKFSKGVNPKKLEFEVRIPSSI